MRKYIGAKLIEAEEMNLGSYNKFRGWDIPEDEDPKTRGYRVVYPDGYVSWSPADVFEVAYMEISPENKITQENVDRMIFTIDAIKWGEKTTVVRAELINGFVIVESSSCVDPENFDMDLGVEICKKKIEDKIWAHMGFLFQQGKEGF